MQALGVSPVVHTAVLRQGLAAVGGSGFVYSRWSVRPSVGSLRGEGSVERRQSGNDRELSGVFDVGDGLQRCRRQSHADWRVFALQTVPEPNLKWILEAVGDGDCSHLDQDVPLPGSFELSLDSATLGRVEGQVDVVLGVATVSGLHARLEKKGNTLYVTDLDSTNGTYVNGLKLRPGAVTPVPPGSLIVFGDEHLAVFRFSQTEEEAVQEVSPE